MELSIKGKSPSCCIPHPYVSNDLTVKTINQIIGISNTHKKICSIEIMLNDFEAIF